MKEEQSGSKGSLFWKKSGDRYSFYRDGVFVGFAIQECEMWHFEDKILYQMDEYDDWDSLIRSLDNKKESHLAAHRQNTAVLTSVSGMRYNEELLKNPLYQFLSLLVWVLPIVSILAFVTVEAIIFKKVPLPSFLQSYIVCFLPFFLCLYLQTRLFFFLGLFQRVSVSRIKYGCVAIPSLFVVGTIVFIFKEGLSFTALGVLLGSTSGLILYVLCCPSPENRL